MQHNIHPEYIDISATCSCGNVINTRSTVAKDIQLDICSDCHPFFTGQQKMIDTAGRVERFRKRYSRKKATDTEATSDK